MDTHQLTSLLTAPSCSQSEDRGSTIQRGTSAIFFLIRSADQAKLLASFSRYEETILKTLMSTKQEDKLRAALTHEHRQKIAKG